MSPCQPPTPPNLQPPHFEKSGYAPGIVQHRSEYGYRQGNLKLSIRELIFGLIKSRMICIIKPSEYNQG